MADGHTRLRKAEDEIAALREEVALLRASQAAETAHAAHCCHGCHCCGHVHWNLYHWPYTYTHGAAGYPAYTQVWTNSGATGTITTTYAAGAGYGNTTYTITN